MGEPTKLRLDQRATYEIRLRGRVNMDWVERISDLTLTVEAGAGGATVSILTGTMDQAALHGLLRELYAMGLPLLGLTILTVDPQPGPS